MKAVGRLALYVAVSIFLVLSLFPFYWMFVIGSRTTADTNRFPPALLPGGLYVENITKVFQEIPFFLALWNTVMVASIVTASTLFFGSLAAFAFSKLKFPGRGPLFVFIVATLMIPGQLGLVPTYIIMSNFGWINDLKAVIVPGLVGAFGIFWLKQYIDSSVHNELVESARIDGCTNFQTYLNVVLPTIRPALASLGILTFMGVWNDFLWPSVVLKDAEIQTIQIALRNLNKVYYRDNAMIMAGTFLATLPLLAAALAFSKQFIAGLTQGAVKG
ncbi:carbohydrate ABC transporter permease [Paenibacillus sp.]|uniref:carbohydrate ABC transporter permease n=1 Tax=Paenibacillus sp. TaxID=58172 RepID=UPI002D66F716|nr:carbohydrate ABC transporter permease [Paenibacillus sp.]HZG87265.1 carbohydrate ABC transporter permease [Paenibacillus sp.]